jgi:7-keto-8-aminopelargonate synthetase-like enzyme
MINFAGFNYLGLGSHPHVVAAAKGAIDQYGTSASASRVVAGELPLYRHLEDRLAAAYRVDDAVICPSGFLTNAAVISFLLTPADLAVCDELVHSSIVSGTQWAQCRRVMFRHNDPESLEVMLRRMRGSAERALVILEGVYSMDGDIAALPEMVAVAREYDSLIMIDEAHSLGTIGDAGMGVREHYGLPGDAVDIWMGTLSKSLAGCGGYVAGSADLMWAIRMLAPGISLYTTGPTPAQIAASTAAFDVLRAEPQRVRRLQDNAAHMLAALRESGWNTGASAGTPIVPLIIGEQIATVELSVWLLQNGINAVPITQHGVNAGQDRVRLFVSSEHNASQIDELVRLLHQYRSTTS